MHPIIEKFSAIEWEYAHKDHAALSELRDRIRETGRKYSLISYGDLVDGIDFHYPEINDGMPHRISISEWAGINRRIVLDCLGYISMESYMQAGVMASALVVQGNEPKPSGIFVEWMTRLGILPDQRERTILSFWNHQVKKVHHSCCSRKLI